MNIKFIPLLIFTLSSFGWSDSSLIKVGSLNLKIPSEWKQEQPTSDMRAGQFAITAADGQKIEYIVFHFGGGGGDANSNINRWVNQFDPEGRTHKTTTGDSSNGKYNMVDIQGTFNKTVGPPMMGKTTPVANSRVIAVILDNEAGSYYIKLIGLIDNIEKIKSDFFDSFGMK